MAGKFKSKGELDRDEIFKISLPTFNEFMYVITSSKDWAKSLVTFIVSVMPNVSYNEDTYKAFTEWLRKILGLDRIEKMIDDRVQKEIHRQVRQKLLPRHILIGIILDEAQRYNIAMMTEQLAEKLLAERDFPRDEKFQYHMSRYMWNWSTMMALTRTQRHECQADLEKKKGLARQVIDREITIEAACNLWEEYMLHNEVETPGVPAHTVEVVETTVVDEKEEEIGPALTEQEPTNILDSILQASDSLRPKKEEKQIILPTPLVDASTALTDSLQTIEPAKKSERQCEECGNPYTPATANQKFCGPKCVTTNKNKKRQVKKERKENKELAKTNGSIGNELLSAVIGGIQKIIAKEIDNLTKSVKEIALNAIKDFNLHSADEVEKRETEIYLWISTNYMKK